MDKLTFFIASIIIDIIFNLFMVAGHSMYLFSKFPDFYSGVFIGIMFIGLLVLMFINGLYTIFELKQNNADPKTKILVFALSLAVYTFFILNMELDIEWLGKEFTKQCKLSAFIIFVATSLGYGFIRTKFFNEL